MSSFAYEAPRSAKSLAWSATVAALAIEKIRQGVSIAEDEKLAIAETAQELSLLSKASRLEGESLVYGTSERLSSALRESLSTLVALETVSSYSVDPALFEEVGKNLSRVVELVEESQPLSLPDHDLERAQSLCFDLLDQLSGHHRPVQVPAEPENVL
jgi:hypothetical protein